MPENLVICNPSFDLFSPVAGCLPFDTFVSRFDTATRPSSRPFRLFMPYQLLENAVKLIKTKKPWNETLGLGSSVGADAGGDEAVEAANETVLVPVIDGLRELLGAFQGAALARDDTVELVGYCVAIFKCLLELAKASDMPSSTLGVVQYFKAEIEGVGKFVQARGTRSVGLCGKGLTNSQYRDTADRHKQKLRELLSTVLIDLELKNRWPREGIRETLRARQAELAEIPRGAPILPPAYVQRTALMERVVNDLIDPQRSATAVHCLLGMGGGGKTLLASSVVRDDRIRASFKNGIFWVPVGREDDDVLSLLKFLANELARVFADTPLSWPSRFESVEEVVGQLSSVREASGLRCLVVLDNVCSEGVVNAFTRTGFHVLVTTRKRSVVSRPRSDLCTEVGDTSKEDALEVVRRPSGAELLPAKAIQVRM